jgi:hypothetical protein
VEVKEDIYILPPEVVFRHTDRSAVKDFGAMNASAWRICRRFCHQVMALQQ